MGYRVHVVSRSAEYGYGGFNWKVDEFMSFLDTMGCCTSRYGDTDDFDCSIDDYKKVVWAVSIFVHANQESSLYKKFKQFLKENALTLAEFTDSIGKLGDNDQPVMAIAKETLKTMVNMLITRDKHSIWISFSTF